MSDYSEDGRALMRRMMGEEFATKMEAGAASERFGADVTKMAIEFAFGATWSRPGMELKTRSTVIIAVLIAQGQPEELKNHIRFGLNNGLTERDIQEIIIQTLPYVGFPAVSTALRAAIEVLRERGLAAGVQTSQERGLL